MMVQKSTKTRAEYDEWLTIFRLRREDLLSLLQAHHRGNSFGINLHANSRAREAIEDALRVAEALIICRRDALTPEPPITEPV